MKFWNYRSQPISVPPVPESACPRISDNPHVRKCTFVGWNITSTPDMAGTIFARGTAKLYFAPGSDAVNCWFYSYDPKIDARRHGERVRDECIRIVEGLTGFTQDDPRGETIAAVRDALVTALRAMPMPEPKAEG